MKKDDFSLHYQYDHELSARLKNRRARLLHYWKILLIFSVAAFVIPLFFGKIDLSAIIFLIAFVVFSVMRNSRYFYSNNDTTVL